MHEVTLCARYLTDSQSVVSIETSSISVVSMRVGSVGKLSIPTTTPPSAAPVSFSGRVSNHCCRTPAWQVRHCARGGFGPRLSRLEHVSAEQNRKVPGRIKGFPRGCLWVILLALILVWRPSDAKLVYCRDA